MHAGVQERTASELLDTLQECVSVIQGKASWTVSLKGGMVCQQVAWTVSRCRGSGVLLVGLQAAWPVSRRRGSVVLLVGLQVQ